MSADTFFRLIIAVCALATAIMIVVSLASGHVRWQGRAVERAQDEPGYWTAVGVNTAFLLTFILALGVPDRAMAPAVFIGILGSQLIHFLVSGEVPRFRGRVWSRAGGERGYWRWVTFHAIMLAIFIVAFALTLLRPDLLTTP